MRYRVWESFTDEARRAAATARYPNGISTGFARTVEGCCPLGVALRTDGTGHPKGGAWHSPGSLLVALALGDASLNDSAAAFITDWDGGKIRQRDLAALLEVTR